jgi:signal transduction histidine kinase
MAAQLHVLFVEDSPDDAKLLMLELRRGGWDVVHERVDTAEAMETALASRPWDVIIADYSMPHFSGVAALAVAKQRAADVPFILVSGTVGEDVAVEAVKAGAHDYLFKGNLRRLVSAIQRELREAEVRRNARQIAQNLHKREKQLADARKLARLGAWHLDLHYKSALWSDETYEIFGLDPRGSSMAFDTFLHCLHPDDRGRFVDLIGEPGATKFEMDLRVVRPDKSTRFVHIRGDILRESGGAAIEAAGMIQDITERKLGEEALKHARDDLAAANRAKDQFLAVLSHELRTPLTPVMMILSQLEDRKDLSEELRDDLTTVRCNVELEARLIDDLLDLTRIVQTKLELHQEVVDLHAVLKRVATLFKQEISDKKQQLVLKFDAKNPRVWADPRRIQQILVNLVGNAVKFTPDAGRVEIRTADEGGNILSVEIADNGIGIEPDLLPRIFEAFQQGDSTLTRRFGGLGLGLSICKALIELHGGTIRARSDGRGKGATLRIELNLAPAEGAETLARSAPSVVGKSVLQSKHVLLVEDHEDTRRAMCRILSVFGCHVTPAATVREAIDLADQNKFELLVSDIGLPDGTGMDVIKHMRAQYGVRGIAVSGYGREEDLRRSREAGFDMHLTKPIDFKTLQDALQQLLAQ